jgi:pilus assembly protein Flp/PilA
MLKLFVSMQTYVTGVLNRDRGATAVEYGLLVGLIAAVIIVTVVLLGKQVEQAFTKVSGALTTGGISGT